MEPWLPFAIGALVVWSIQRVVTKLALVRWSTAYFYRLNAFLSLLVYAPFAVLNPPHPAGLAGAFALSLLMAATFWVTTEATRRGPVGLVSPLTALSPALTVVLALLLLAERPTALALAGVVLGALSAALLAFRPAAPGALAGWLGLACASLAMQGVGAFIAKIVVTGSGPTDLLLTSASVQLAVGAVIARREPLGVSGLASGRGLAIVGVLISAAVATIGYLYALSVGPASVVVPLVATSPSLAGLLGVVVLRERSTPRQIIAIALGMVAAVILATG
ncbi:MAG TPA: EamA family transporter [Candidatus Limnocylindria bacterium]|nr:EamA family transporter [Candidatus Limnocylindria bacterium]